MKMLLECVVRVVSHVVLLEKRERERERERERAVRTLRDDHVPLLLVCPLLPYLALEIGFLAL